MLTILTGAAGSGKTRRICERIRGRMAHGQDLVLLTPEQQILLILAVVLLIVGALLARFVFKDDITRIVEQIIPGYTIQWN